MSTRRFSSLVFAYFPENVIEQQAKDNENFTPVQNHTTCIVHIYTVRKKNSIPSLIGSSIDSPSGNWTQHIPQTLLTNTHVKQL